MSERVCVRLLVPKRNAEGKIVYHAEMHWVRLPLKRDDRLSFLERLTAEEE
jgi:hypothetical protein